MSVLATVAVAVVAQAALQAPERWTLSAEPIVEIGAVEGTGPDVFGNVRGVAQLAGGTVAVADGVNVEIRFFEETGEFIRTVGGRGDGPGEFRTIMSLGVCAPDEVWVYDPAHARLTRYDGRGSLLGTLDVRSLVGQRPPPRDFVCGSTGALAFLHRPTSPPPPSEGPHRPSADISLHVEGGFQGPLGSFPGPERYFAEGNDFPRPFGLVTSMAFGPTALYVLAADRSPEQGTLQVRAFALDGEVLEDVSVQASSRPLRRAHVAAFLSQLTARAGSSERRRSMEDFYGGLSYPDLLPPTGIILTSPTGDLWVEEFTPPGATERHWRVYAPSGELRAVVEVPPDFHIHQVGMNQVVGVREDELGVHYVRVHGVSRGR